MICYKGKKTIEVSEKAYELIFKVQGYKIKPVQDNIDDDVEPNIEETIISDSNEESEGDE